MKMETDFEKQLGRSLAKLAGAAPPGPDAVGIAVLLRRRRARRIVGTTGMAVILVVGAAVLLCGRPSADVATEQQAAVPDPPAAPSPSAVAPFEAALAAPTMSFTPVGMAGPGANPAFQFDVPAVSLPPAEAGPSLSLNMTVPSVSMPTFR
jgi:hypothetical protein